MLHFPAMPTTRPRHVVTESEAVAQALDDAAQRWPDDSGNRSKLLVLLVQEGHRALIVRRRSQEEAARQAVLRTSGALTGLYGADYLGTLRDDWPG